jgi:hypothetical protein
MRLSSLILGLVALALVGFLIWSFGAFPGRNATAAGVTPYNPATEVELKGVVKEVRDFACPESEHGMGAHLMLQTASGVIQVHVAPSQLMRSRHLSFAPGEQITVVGSEIRVFDRYDVLAREIRRGNETVVLRDQYGKLVTEQ